MLSMEKNLLPREYVDQFSLSQFFLQNGRPDLADKEKRNMPKMKKGGAVKRNKPKPKKGSTVRGSGIARQGVRKAKIR